MASSTWRESSPSIRRTWSVTPAASANASRKRAARSPPSPPARASVRSTLLCDERPLGDLEDDLRERLLGGHERRAVTRQALSAKHVRERLAERRARGRDLRLALPGRQLEGELEPAAAREQPEQVVEDGDAGGDIRAPATGRDPGAHGSETSQIGGYKSRGSPMIGVGSYEPLQIREIWMRLVNRFCFAVLAGLVLVGSALGAHDPGAGRLAERHRRRLVRERAGPRGGARTASRTGRPPDRRTPSCRAAPAGERRALRSADRRRARHPSRRANGDARLAGRARTLFSAAGLPYQWQYSAVRADQVPAAVAQAAAGLTIAVIDTGADLSAPDLSAKTPQTYSIRKRLADVPDANGHGTFVAALAADPRRTGRDRRRRRGGGTDGRAGRWADGAFTDVDEAAAIVYAVDHGARIVNLSLGGSTTSSIEKRAVDYAVAKGALLVAAVGNGYLRGNDVEYPAALLQPVGSKGVGGRGLSVAASNRRGARAPFSSTGSHVSLAAPGVGVFSAVSSASPLSSFPRTELPGALGGLYGYGSGTSFAAPQVAGAAALVWAANPQLRAAQVASILEQTASGRGTWNAELGYGVLDVAAAVAEAQTTAVPPPRSHRPGGWRRRSSAACRARSRRARSRRRGRAGARRSARSRGRSRRRCRSSKSLRRRGPRSGAPSRRGCPGSSAARRRAAQDR